MEANAIIIKQDAQKRIKSAVEILAKKLTFLYSNFFSNSKYSSGV
jgi:hypothetical protein